MTRRRKLILGGAGLAVLAAGAIVWWLASGPGPKVEHSGQGSWPCDPDFTIVERHARKLVIRRVSPEGELTTLGTHPRDDATHAAVTPGVGTFYAITAQEWAKPRECRVYDSGKELYIVPLHLTYVGQRGLAPVAVLPEGRLLATYRNMGQPTNPPEPEELLIERVAILASEGNRVIAHPLAPNPKAFAGLAVSGMAISSDGTTVAVSFRALGAQHGPFRTLVYSAKDLKPLSTIEGFAVQAMGHDGSLMIGRNGAGLAVYRSGQLVAQREHQGLPFLRASWDGAFVFVVQGSRLADVLETKTLVTVFQAHAEPGRGQSTHAVSSTGRLAVVDYAKPSKESVRTRLRVYAEDGAVAFNREFGESRYCAATALHWTRDGKVLYYLLGEKGRVVRCPVQ